MDFYWVYDIPNWLFFTLTASFFILFSLLGAFIFSVKLEEKLGLTIETNNIVTTFLGLSGVFYGITLGLIAVGTFENFNKVDGIVNDESSSLSALYSDVSMLEQPVKIKLNESLKTYTKYVIEKAWPSQRKGIVPKGGNIIIKDFQNKLASYNPITAKDQIIYAQVFDQYNQFLEKRRLRLNAVSNSLPATIWGVLFLGAFVNIILTWLLVIKNKKLDILINTLMGLLLGLLIFLIAAMDNPFRGEYSVSSNTFKLLYDGLMK